MGHQIRKANAEIEALKKNDPTTEEYKVAEFEKKAGMPVDDFKALAKKMLASGVGNSGSR